MEAGRQKGRQREVGRNQPMELSDIRGGNQQSLVVGGYKEEEGATETDSQVSALLDCSSLRWEPCTDLGSGRLSGARHRTY